MALRESKAFSWLFIVLVMSISFETDGQEKVLRLGMIGLDTSHVVSFTKRINDPKNNYGCKVVAGFVGGSPDIPSSANRIEKFTQALRDEHGLRCAAVAVAGDHGEHPLR